MSMFILLLVSEDRAYSPEDYSPSRHKGTKLTPANVQPPGTIAGKKIISLLPLMLLDRISTTKSDNTHALLLRLSGPFFQSYSVLSQSQKVYFWDCCGSTLYKPTNGANAPKDVSVPACDSMHPLFSYDEKVSLRVSTNVKGRLT